MIPVVPSILIDKQNSMYLTKEKKNGDSSDEDDESDSGYLHESNGVRGAVIKKAWDHMYESENNDHLLFGSPRTNIDLSTLHPGQAQIFRLWQIYLENVNPLLKVTHTPTWQSRIIDAVTDLSSISPATESLLFSIYCISIVSLTDEECRASFGSPRKDLLANYQFGCRQALLNCRVLRTSDLDCLTAFYLYLVSKSRLLGSRALYDNNSFSHSHAFRSQFDPKRTPVLWHPCLVSLSASPNAWALTERVHIPGAQLLKVKCVGDSGGHWSFSTIAFARCLTTSLQRLALRGTVERYLM